MSQTCIQGILGFMLRNDWKAKFILQYTVFILQYKYFSSNDYYMIILEKIITFFKKYDSNYNCQ